MLGAINKLGILGTVASTAVNLGCCAPQVLGPLTAVLFAGGLLDSVPVTWQFRLLCASLGVALVGFALGWRRHRRLAPILIFLLGAAAILYTAHAALDVTVLKVLIWLAFGLLLAATAWDTWLSVRTRSCRVTLSRSEVSQ